jgi:hypothetical protein
LKQPLLSTTVGAWIHVLPLLDLKRPGLFFTPIVDVTPITTQGRKSRDLKIQLSLSFRFVSFSFTIGFFVYCSLLL